MFSNKFVIYLLIFYIVTLSCKQEQIADKIGQWRVVTGPPGNEFYLSPETNNRPPSEEVIRITRIFVPHIKASKWEMDDDNYDIRCEEGYEEYRFEITPQGDLIKLRYENDETNVDEDAEELVLRGTKKSIMVSELPERTLAMLANAYPNLRPEQVWTAETIAGQRYVIKIGKMAFYARNDGQIQTGRRIDDGGLNEIDPPIKMNENEFEEEVSKLLGPYQKYFNFEDNIKRMGGNTKGEDRSYRYVVMGDSRSNWDLWSNMVKHIDGLVPKPTFVINSGDIVPMGYAREFREYYIPPLLKTEIPFFVAIGNHETGDNDMAYAYRYLFGDKSLNYYFDFGKARFIFFDNTSVVNSSEKNLKWLEKTLMETPKDYRKYVIAHKPPSTITKWAYHAWDDIESKIFTDLMTGHEVDEVYLGHIHAYSTAKYGGVNYTLSGGGGAGLHDRYGPGGNIHHYIICDVSPQGHLKQQVVRFYDTTKETKKVLEEGN